MYDDFLLLNNFNKFVLSSLVTPTLTTTLYAIMVDAVTVKLPAVWTTSATAWFAQVEAKYAIGKITEDDTKYYHVVAALDSVTDT